MSEIIEVRKRDVLLALIIKNDFKREGVEFITDPDYSQQVAYMSHPKGKRIDAHVHKIVHRDVIVTQEVLVLKKGILRVDFYDLYKEYLESYIISAGDTIILVSGGHGFEVMEDVEMIEIKQGPYADKEDKERFSAVSYEEVRIRED